jgi:hypothetical protein
MTPSERMAAATSRQIPDRVPVMCQMSIGHRLVQTGFRRSEFRHPAGTFAAGLLRLRSLCWFDGVLVSLRGRRAGWEKDVLGVGRDGAREHIRWKDGRRTSSPVDDLPVPGPEPEPRPAFSTFDPGGLSERVTHIPVSQGPRFPLDPDRLFEVFDLVGPAVRGHYSFWSEVTSPLDYSLDLFGFEQGLAGLVDDGSRAEAVLARLTGGIPPAQGMVERGVEAVKISSRRIHPEPGLFDRAPNPGRKRQDPGRSRGRSRKRRMRLFGGASDPPEIPGTVPARRWGGRGRRPRQEAW